MTQKKTVVLTLILIFCISFFVRWFKISEYLFFGYEQGRDALIIQKIYELGDYVLVGPSTSIGGLFHGPWYYYLLVLPYGLSGGNPLSASFWLIILGSLVPVVVLLFASDVFKSKIWGVICSMLVVFSFEYILYSRWLSNVSSAPLFVVLSFFMLWKYLHLQKRKYFLWFVVFSSFASLFQMILAPQFLFVLILLALFKQLKLPAFKTTILSFLIILFLFSPLIFFDFRNEHITFNSLINFSNDSSITASTLVSNVTVYFRQLYQHIVLSVLYIKFLPVQVLLLSAVSLGTIIGYLRGQKKVTLFILSWVLMTLPLIKISPGNPQYYLSVGLGSIFLFCFSMKNLWEIKYLKFIPVAFGFLVLISFYQTISSLVQNRDIFFRTSQEDLVYSDQKQLLKFIGDDSKNGDYKLTAFTIPSLHPEGWEYLHSYYYPDDKAPTARIIYIVIEKDVYPVWEQKWINDLGKTKLTFEKRFGLLRLQKREVID